MDITITLTGDEARVARFMMGGAPQNPSVDPPSRIAAQSVLAKIDAALAAPEPAPGPAPELTE